MDYLKTFTDKRGSLTLLEFEKQVPFTVTRVYWIYDVPGGDIRGGHAYNENQEFIIALSGSFDIIIDDGKARRKFSLNRSYYGLYVPQQLWRQIENFSTNSLALVLSSTIYDENDYIREYEKFLLMKESEKNDI